MNRIIRFIKHVIGLLKRGYLYYYYLCFKDFIKKLLKPKKMIPIKWRNDPNGDFKFVTYIEENLITRYVGRIRNNVFFNNNDTFKFKFNNITTTPTSIYENDVINPLIKPKNDFYFVEKKCLVEYRVDEFNDNSIVFYSENFTHFKIGDSEWMPIENIDYRYGGLCLFSFEYKLFVRIETNLIMEANKDEIDNLIERNLNEFITYIQKI